MLDAVDAIDATADLPTLWLGTFPLDGEDELCIGEDPRGTLAGGNSRRLGSALAFATALCQAAVTTTTRSPPRLIGAASASGTGLRGWSVVALAVESSSSTGRHRAAAARRG